MNSAAQSQTLLIGRVLLALVFLVAGIRIILSYSGNIGYFTKLGFPAPEVMTVLAILIEIGGGVLLILGWQTRRISWLLVLFVIIATAMAHRFWEFDAAQYGNQPRQPLFVQLRSTRSSPRLSKTAVCLPPCAL